MTAEIFDTVEELTGKYPTFTDLQNAVHAIITKSILNQMEHSVLGMGNGLRKTYLRQVWRNVEAPHIMKNVDYIAKSYAYNRPILVEGHHLRLNPHFQATK